MHFKISIIIGLPIALVFIGWSNFYSCLCSFNLIKVIIMIHHHLYQQNNILKKKLIMEVFFVKFGLPRRVKDNGFFLERFSWEVIKKLFSILIVKVTLITKINFVCFFNLYYCSIYEYLILFCISYLTKEKGSWKSNKFPEVFDSAHN